jgi:hypothetical protein
MQTWTLFTLITALVLDPCTLALDIPYSRIPDRISNIDTIRFKDAPPSDSHRLTKKHLETPQWLFFISSETVETNSTDPFVEWEFISHMTITPAQCDIINHVVQMLDEALQRANPGVENLNSTALRLGNTDCIDGVCPCNRQKRGHHRVFISHLLLEVKTRSSTPDLKPPLQFPLRVASFDTRKSS